MQPSIEIPERTESVACPLCGGTQGVVVGRRGRFGMAVRNLCCDTCALIYVTPRPTPHAMARHCAELVEWLMQHGCSSMAWLLLEKLGQHEHDAELRADLLAMADRCGGVEATASV